MTFFPENLNTFESISLEEMNVVKLLDRVDTKFTFHIDKLNEILSIISNDYKILTINNLRFARYETRYYDTPAYEMYTKHHNGKLNRKKVRFRTYMDTNIHYFEVKNKTNKGRTIKTRLRREMNDYNITDNAKALLETKTQYLTEELQEAIRIFYKRITLVSKNMTERLTIDFEMRYVLNEKEKEYPNLVIAELKQDKSSKSHFAVLMNTLKIKDISMSKYCLGVASLADNVKKNNFKSKIHYVDKLCNSNPY